MLEFEKRKNLLKRTISPRGNYQYDWLITIRYNPKRKDSWRPIAVYPITEVDFYTFPVNEGVFPSPKIGTDPQECDPYFYACDAQPILIAHEIIPNDAFEEYFYIVYEGLVVCRLTLLNCAHSYSGKNI